MEKQNKNREQLKKMYIDFELTPDDVFSHKNYVILTRSGIEKIMAKSKISVTYDIIKSERDFASVKATSTLGEQTLETTGSALRGATYKDGNTLSHYVLEMAEKRSMARAVLKILNLYEIGVKSEDESDEFNKSN
tara:strand:- start:20496 stop:20900 length:405 start_codon:yes stop_codon:yes gene_type:complete